MGVAIHLGIRLTEYDQRIRTFIPHYEEMLSVVAQAASWTARHATIVDLGVGTGALASRCLASVPGARVIGIDVDAGVLRMAERRLARQWPRATRHGDRLAPLTDQFEWAASRKGSRAVVPARAEPGAVQFRRPRSRSP